jgi:cytochrome c oxidase cbb3-type subunit III
MKEAFLTRYFRVAAVLSGAGILAICIGASVSGSAVLAAGQQPPAPAAAANGQRLFVTNCGFCHGSDARGGAEAGPDLTRSPIALSGAQLVSFLKVGRPPRMPQFDLPDADVMSLSAFIASQSQANGRNAPTDPTLVLVGNAEAGKAYFNGPGKCTTCHSATGDLKNIGSKYNPQLLQGRMILARGSGGYPGLSFGPARANIVDVPRKVEVTPAKGPAVSGELVKVSDYVVTLKDTNGMLHTFTRDGAEPKVKITDPLQAHIDMLPKWTSRDMHDVTAYLVTLK